MVHFLFPQKKKAANENEEKDRNYWAGAREERDGVYLTLPPLLTPRDHKKKIKSNKIITSVVFIFYILLVVSPEFLPFLSFVHFLWAISFPCLLSPWPAAERKRNSPKKSRTKDEGRKNKYLLDRWLALRSAVAANKQMVEKKKEK